MHRENVHPLEIIVAVDEEGGFGKDGKIPWHYSEDLKHFKDTTTGHVCIMGRKTYEDMLAMRKDMDAKKKKRGAAIDEILPNRQSFVVTSNAKFKAPGATVVRNLREAVNSLAANDKRKVFVIGGERMYIEALTSTTFIHMTMVPGSHACDKFFPIKVLNKFQIKSGKKEGELKFITYERVRW